MASTATHITATPTAIQTAAPSAAATRANPLVLWHLLSLDAPTVAAVWTWFLARTAHVPLPAGSIAGMFVAVWILYAADRLLDARLLDARLLNARGSSHPEPLELRHHFHHRHRTRFVAGIAVAGVALSALIPRLAPAALRLYLVEGAALVAWFLILHATAVARRLPKEFVVGIFFATAVFIPTVARRPDLRLVLLPGVALLAAIATLNCLFIHAWEHTPRAPANPVTSFSARHICTLSIITAAAALAVAAASGPALWPVPAACAGAVTALLVLHRVRGRLARTTLRAAADVALLAPLLLLPFTR
ncbi:MAG: hypothetical protein M3O02_02565 [Acidobacteriota bacterium]|nr:hypothetical protein [Acidobacteriota bacterium]